MVNVYDFMKSLPPAKRLFVNDLLFADYKCPLEETRFDMWTHHNYFVYVIKGKKKWFSGEHEVLAEAGDCLFVKKGAHSIYQYFDDEFCSLFMFVPDEFIRRTLLDNEVGVDVRNDADAVSPVLRIHVDEMLTAYFVSFLSYVSESGSADETLVELKFKELILMVASRTGNESLSSYFLHLCNTTRPSLQAVMESNFTYPMTLQEYARLSGRSLSTFRRDFSAVYDTTPGRWLQQRRLDFGRYLLEHTDRSVTEVMLDCGFKNASHFSRAFKQAYGKTPLQYKKSG